MAESFCVPGTPCTKLAVSPVGPSFGDLVLVVPAICVDDSVGVISQVLFA